MKWNVHVYVLSAWLGLHWWYSCVLSRIRDEIFDPIEDVELLRQDSVFVLQHHSYRMLSNNNSDGLFFSRGNSNARRHQQETPKRIQLDNIYKKIGPGMLDARLVPRTGGFLW